MDPSHDWIAPESFQIDAPYGAKTCSRCHVCTCHDVAASREPCTKVYTQ